jgi:DNA-binding NarL/FixJ family response regulator
MRDSPDGVRGDNGNVMKPIRLLLVDDEPAIRRGLRMRLALESDVEVVGEAGDGVSALQEVQRLAPQVVLMDVEMPGMDGIAATSRLRAQAPRPAVVMLSMHDDQGTVARALAAGAAAFVAKHSIDAALLAAIRQAASREGEEAP